MSVFDGVSRRDRTQTTAYLGTVVDHLIPTCPGLRRSMAAYPDDNIIGKKCVDLVDPLGTDLCGWCVRVWKARNRVTGHKENER